MDKYFKLETQFKELARNGKISEALTVAQEAYKIHPNEKLMRRIRKLEAYFAEHGDALPEEDSDMIHVGKGFYLYKKLHEKLYPYQIEGVLWLWSLYKRKKGGILGDDMGLGKTIQVIAFLSGLFDLEEIKYVLIVVPVSLIPTWRKEFDRWAPGLRVRDYYGSSKKERERQLNKVRRDGGILITTYGLLVSCCDNFANSLGKEFVWDYMILDEGHKIKNPTKTTKAAHEVSAVNRIVLSGTPLQNNLRELWALFDFVHHGTLLGTSKTFKMEFETPITRAREKDATVGEKKLGQQIAESLHKVIKPYFLRRTKADVLENNKENVKPKDMPSLARKNDLIIWLSLSKIQIPIYKDFLELDRVKQILMTKRSPLVELTVLKKICDHPRLLSRKACIQLGLDMDCNNEDFDEDELDLESCKMSIDHVEDEILIEESGKMQILLKLLNNLKSEGHRILIFSLSRKILDIIERILKNLNYKVLRLDGTISKPEDRQKIINKFQGDPSYTVMLLTTQVGGVGLTLTAADRVIIYDPSWNPATDAQAVDRVYRIGQQKSVIIYRLITCGTVEEKIYRRQVFKDSLTKLTTGDEKNPYRYFTKQELRELFTLENPYYSATQIQLKELHHQQRKTDEELESHIDFLCSLDIFGISDHDLMFNSVIKEEEEHHEGEMGEDYIQDRVARAQQIIKLETDLIKQKTIETGRYRGPTELNYIKPPLMKIDSKDLDDFDSKPKEEPLLEESMKDLSIHEFELSNNNAFHENEEKPFKADANMSGLNNSGKNFITIEESDNDSLMTSLNNSDCKLVENKFIDDDPIIIEESEEEFISESPKKLMESRDIIAESDDDMIGSEEKRNVDLNKKQIETSAFIIESDDDQDMIEIEKKSKFNVAGDIEDSPRNLMESPQPSADTAVASLEAKLSPNFKACMNDLLSFMSTPKGFPEKRKSMAKRKSFARYKSVESDLEDQDGSDIKDDSRLSLKNETLNEEEIEESLDSAECKSVSSNLEDADDSDIKNSSKLSLKSEASNNLEMEESRPASAFDRSSKNSTKHSSSVEYSNISGVEAEFEDSSDDERNNKRSIRRPLSDRKSYKSNCYESSENSSASNTHLSELSFKTPHRREISDSPLSIKKRARPLKISDDEDDDFSPEKELDFPKDSVIKSDLDESDSESPKSLNKNNSQVQNSSLISKKEDCSTSFTSNETMSIEEGENYSLTETDESQTEEGSETDSDSG